MRVILFLSIFISTHAWAIDVNSKWLKKVGECIHQENAKNVLLIKQWHFSPGVNTRTPSNRQHLPQAENQIEIYRQLEAWIKSKSADELVVEGCAGKIDEQFKEVFYGWSMKDLEATAKNNGFTVLLAHPGMKLKAQFKDKVNVDCGDDIDEMKKGDLALSDARGDVGYLSRLEQYKNDPARAKTYLEGVVESFHLNPKTSIETAIATLKKDIKKSVKILDETLHERNVRFVKAAKNAESKLPVIVVVGGLHSEDLMKLMNEEKLNCEVYEPVSYRGQEETLKKDLAHLLE